MKRCAGSILLLAATLLQFGCADTFFAPSFITRVRITGTKVAIPGDLSRAWLHAGDMVCVAIALEHPRCQS